MWNPKDYAKNSNAQLKWAQELRKKLNLQGKESILDVGCGDGKITADFAIALPESRVVGIDSSPEMIDYATQSYPLTEYPNLTFICADARYFDFNDEFDLCFSNATLHWVDDHQAFLKCANQVLHSGGRLLISCGGKGNASDIIEVFSEILSDAKWREYCKTFKNPYYFYGVEEYELWLKEAGFKIEQLELVIKDMTHTGKEGLAGWIRTTWMPLTHLIPEHKRDIFIDHFVQIYLNRIPLDSNGLAHVKMVRLEVDAIKYE